MIVLPATITGMLYPDFTMLFTYTINTICFIFLLFYFLTLALLPLGLIACISNKMSQQTIKNRQNSKKQPHVTIIKALKGADENLEENLESFCRLDYSNFDIYFCLESADDPASKICEKLKNKYSSRNVEISNSNTRIVIEPMKPVNINILYQTEFYANETYFDQSVFKNPKVKNMKMAYEQTNSEYIWMADSKIYTKPGTLSHLVTEILNEPENTACIHCNPLFKESRSKIDVEKVYFYTHHARQYCSSGFLGIPCLTGQSVLAKRSKLEKFGGLKAVENYLAEDFYLCKFISENGDKLKLSRFPALQNAPKTKKSENFTCDTLCPPTPRCRTVNSICGSICNPECDANIDNTAFVNRMLRWYKLRRDMVPAVSYLEVFFECIVSAVYGPAVLYFMIDQCKNSSVCSKTIPPVYLPAGVNYWTTVGTHIFVWFCFDTAQACILGVKVLSYGYLKSWVVRHFVFLKIYFLGFFGFCFGYGSVDQVVWADKTYVIKDGKLLEKGQSSSNSRFVNNSVNGFTYPYDQSSSTFSSEMSSRNSSSQSPNLLSPGVYAKRQHVNAESHSSSSTSLLVDI